MKYVTLRNNISINNAISKISRAYILFNCKPLMPKNPLKRIKAIFYYLHCNNSQNEIKELPVIGDIAIKVSDSNYKIINLKESIIYTLFNIENEKEDVYEKLEYSKSSLLFEEILHVDRQRKIIKGVFYNGFHPNFTRPSFKLKKRLIEMLERLIIHSEVKEVSAEGYVNQILLESLDIINRNQHAIKQEHIEIAKKFLQKHYDLFIKNNSEQTIKLILSHGDIKQDNIIQMKDQLVLIDWEFCAFRSPLYDVLKFKWRFPNFGAHFYNGLYKQLGSNQVIINVFERNFPNSKEHSLNLFYLEDMRLRLIQYETRGFAQDFSKQIIKKISKIESS